MHARRPRFGAPSLITLLLCALALGLAFWKDAARLRPSSHPSLPQPCPVFDGFPPGDTKPEAVVIDQLGLSIDEQAFSSMFRSPPESLRTWHIASLRLEDGSVHPVEIRGRGGHAWHWDLRKPSLRIRFKDGGQLAGRPVFDLVSPDDAAMLANPIGDLLARRMNLSAATTGFAAVTLNNRLLGLYHLTDRFDSSFLRRSGLEPGPLLEGNSWRPTLWDSIDEWNLPDPDAPEIDAAKNALRGMLRALASSPAATPLGELASHLDCEVYLRWLAFQSLVGSIHTDDRHNHLFRFDPDSRRLVPIVLDSAGFGALTRAAGRTTGDEAHLPLNEPLSPLSDALLRDPLACHQRNLHLWNALSTVASTAVLHGLVDHFTQAISEEVRRDVNRGAVLTVTEIGYPFRLPYSFAAFGSATRELHHWIDERARFIHEGFSQTACVVYRYGEASAPHLVIEVSGHAGVEWRLGEDLRHFHPDSDLDGSISPSEPSLPASSATFPGASGTLLCLPGIRADQEARPPWVMLPQRRLRYALVPASQTYLFALSPDQADRLIARLRREARNAVTGEPVSIREASGRFPSENLYISDEGTHPWKSFFSGAIRR